MDSTTIIGVVASVFTGVSLLPQLLKIIREKNAEGTSWLMLISILIGVSCWTIYGILKDDWIIIISNGFSTLVNITVITLSVLYRHNKKERSSQKA